ncbi:hypothetical protein SLEP1_g5433 [Rubroshorea leprosula]|uniref:Uncharacterized protein n=1 Tax=Rubroshorea leprosula TaxID=152421 RepID=A0AAV5I0S3_9ROSI|nr:hypothetical protein SLEP1_g5433 [Rubroshorea leprosula]
MPPQRNLPENKDAVATNDKALSGLELLMDVIPILVEEYKKLCYSSLPTF